MMLSIIILHGEKMFIGQNINKKMKKIAYIILAFCLFTMASCETEQEVIKTGTCDPKFDGSILEYLRTDNFNWGLTVQMIEKAKMEDIFDGTDPDYPEITFLGLKSSSIIRHVWDLQSKAGEDLIDEDKVINKLTEEDCKTILKKYLIKGKYLKEDLPERDYNYRVDEKGQTGFVELTTLGDNKIRAYVEREDYGGVPKAGAIIMYLYSSSVNVYVTLASPNIQPNNGVIHALGYSHVLGKL